MNRFLLPLLIMACGIIVLPSCNKIPEHARYIPKNALVVGTVDINSLSKKLIWNAIIGSDLFKEMQKEMKNEESKEAMKDVSNIGLNQLSTVYFFYTGDMKQDGKACVLIAMKDQDKFEKFIQKTYPQSTIEKYPEYKSALIESSMYAAWNKDVAMFFPLGSGSIPTDSLGEPSMASAFNSLASVKQYLIEAFKLSKENSIISLKHFTDLQKSGHDISIWANYEELYKLSAGSGDNPAMAFVKQDYFKEAALATGIDFEKGRSAVVMDYYLSKELAEIYGKYSNDNVNADLIDRIDSKDVAMVMAYNLKVQMIQDFLKKFSLDGLVNLGLMSMGTGMENIASAVKGDMVFAITDIKPKTPADSVTGMGIDLSQDLDMNYTFAMSINDEQEIDKLLGKAVKNGVLVKNGNQYVMADADNQAALIKNKEVLVFASQKTMAENYLSGKSHAGSTLPKEAWEQMRSNPFVFYLDIRKIIQLVPDPSTTPEEKQLMTEVKNLMTYAEMHGGKLKNQANHLEGNLYFTNQEENSLIQIIDLGMKMKKISEHKASQTTVQVDTAAVL
ncbi:MAG: DUF4836 family protein [Chitinophagaceae bacterium]|nr:DUF4836 family protein [Chitinophagaceae bacterium]